MKFANIYNETEENLRLALLSLWAPGKHPMRKPIEELFKKEPLITEPVFQSTFGWEAVSDSSWRNYLNTDVIDRLRIGEKYSPYKHQAESWRNLRDGKSIVVTSGTGSGKTECFMYPVISDLYEQGHTNAIQAIFLYPLNALMEDQKNRLSEYCRATGLNFAVYNGSTPEFRENANKLDNEVGTRDEIRDPKEKGTRPQILLSNPSMLEYILVRQKDQRMLEKSKGQLRWIVIDEAHTYSGSAALELANQIKRLLDAFDVKAEDVRFACTSATIGGPEGEKSLAEFISTVIGQPKENIQIIGGRRIVPEISENELKETLTQENIHLEVKNILSLRDIINTQSGLTLRQVWERICPTQQFDTQKALTLVDRLCEINVNGKVLMSLRGHFFMRAISGLYACANEDCPGTSKTPYGRLTTYKSTVCPDCGRPLLELVQCKRCGSFILMGESNPQTHVVSPCTEGFNHEDYFAIDNDPDDELAVNQEEDNARADVFFALPTEKENRFNPLSSAQMSSFDFETYGALEKLELKSYMSGKWSDLRKDARHSYCPKCGKLAHGKRMNFKYFRIPINFINQTISPVFLKECAPENKTWGKYIAFTDSRQGTAISAKTFNIEVERRLCREKLIDELAKRESSASSSTVDFTKPVFATLSPEQIKAIVAAMGQSASNDGIKLYDLADKIFDEQLFKHIAGDKTSSDDRKAYRFALMRSFVGQKQVYQKDSENMGILTLEYPKLNEAVIPNSLSDLAEDYHVHISNQDWRDFLKIALDYAMRASNHIQPLVTYERKYVRDTSIGTPIFEEDWVKIKRSKSGKIEIRQQPRLVVLLCAALGIDNYEKLDKEASRIDTVLHDAWNFLIERNVLSRVNEESNTGYNHPDYYKDAKYVGAYYLDLSPEETNNVCIVRRPKKGWICPISGAVLDTIFCGYSPIMIGEICKGLFDSYRVDPTQIVLPNKPTDRNKYQEWLANDVGLKNLHEYGLWSDRHKYAYQTFPAYIAAEHSAQQSRELLASYTHDFKETKINVLHCSTTMEMGVDIGDVDIVLMDTVPPTAANYLQRVGRAGRMGQTKSIAFSLCNNTPVGQHAFANPMWALQTVNHMIPVKTSQTIVQRHVNSYFFRQFICVQGEGMNITTSIGDFMEGIHSTCDAFVEYLDDMGTNTAFMQKFHKVFGAEVPFTINRTIEDIRTIQQRYKNVVAELEEAHEQFKDEERRKQAIAIQLKRYKQEPLLNYLSEHQFIPNASMPTGVCTFDFMDREQSSRLYKIYRDLEKIKDGMEHASDSEKTELEIRRSKLEGQAQSIKRATQANRDIHTALNEYAPEQTVVVNEKNFISAGVSLFGAYNDATQTRAIYFCKNCGKIEYTTSLNESRTCPNCGEKFHAILGDKNNISYTRAYEPIGFRTDQNVDSSREEQTEKRFYEITPILLSIDWRQHSDVNMCQVVTSGESGEILFYNAGNGQGFAFCKRCGRAAVEIAENGSIPYKVRPGHKQLWFQRAGELCEANDNDIARHVVFTGRLQTCYSVLRFAKDQEQNDFERDKTLAFSMGVILQRALCEYLGIDDTEIGFGYKEELESVSLFIYDTARGGCGYSLHLGNPTECEHILNIARRMLGEYKCDCHLTGGACSRCLIDRNNYRFANLLDKAVVAEWLSKQALKKATIPARVHEVSPEAHVVYQNLKSIVKDAVNNPEVSSMIFFATDNDSDIAINDWSSSKSIMGKLIRQAIANEKQVEIMVEYHSDIHPNVEDRYPFSTIDGRIPDCEVKLINDMGTCKSALLLNYRDGRTHHFFTCDSEVLPLSKDWGNTNSDLFADNLIPSYTVVPFPPIESSNVIIREGLAKPESFKIKNYFSEVIAGSVLKTPDIDKMERMLKNKNVTITFSDMYVNSALSSLMLTYLIKEIKDLFGLKIDGITLQLDSPRRRCNNERHNEHSYISMNWSSAHDADEYTFNKIEDIIGVMPEKSMFDAEHHRYLRIINRNGDVVEIRPDHSIAGGWQSNATYMNADILDGNLGVRRQEDILYYVILKEHE